MIRVVYKQPNENEKIEIFVQYKKYRVIDQCRSFFDLCISTLSCISCIVTNEFRCKIFTKKNTIFPLSLPKPNK